MDNIHKSNVLLLKLKEHSRRSWNLFNGYGHPADDTLNQLDGIGADIYRTDINGLIEIIIDNDNYFIKLMDKKNFIKN